MQEASPTVTQSTDAWLRRVGLMNDYVNVPYANGSSFASQFLYRQLSQRNLEVTVVGPRENVADDTLLPPRTVLFDSLPLRSHPGVYLSFPTPRGLQALARANLDLLLAQTCNGQLFAGMWLRAKHGVPYVCVNTVHLPSVYNTVLPEFLLKQDIVVRLFSEGLVPWLESSTVTVYNHANCLVTLSPGMERYWRTRGVTAPIRVIPRAIETRIFDRKPEADPFPGGAPRGERLLVVCRHVREKNIARLLRLFADHVAPARPNASLTLVGDGPDHDAFRKLTHKLRLGDRVFFPGEQPLTEIPNWYAHADLFVYTSLSETFGQVIGEAMWCGLPVVAFEDNMGVSGQVSDGVDGYLIDPAADGAERKFGERVLTLLADESLRADFGRRARQGAERRASPGSVTDAYMEVFDAAKRDQDAQPPASAAEARRALRSWASVHSAAAAAGLLRRPATLNRNKAAPPDWNLSARAVPTEPTP